MALVIAIGGGKGGVGKSLISLNLAYALSELGLRTVIVDADLGSANIHTLCGIDNPRITIQALLEGKTKMLQETVIPSGYPNLGIVAGSGIIHGAKNIIHAQKIDLSNHIQDLNSDVVVMDIGASVIFNMVDLFNSASIRLLVATHQLISLQNTYRFLQRALFRSMKSVARNIREEELLNYLTSRSETEKISDIIEHIRSQEPEFADRISVLIQSGYIGIIGNQLEKRKQVKVLHSFTKMINDYLSVQPVILGGLSFNARMHRSVSERRLFLRHNSTETEAMLLRNIAIKLSLLDTRPAEQKNLNLQQTFSVPETQEGQLQLGESNRPRSRISGLKPPPASVKRYKRKHERYAVNLPAEVSTEHQTENARVVSLSYGGALIYSNIQTNPGDGIILSFLQLKGQPQFRGQVRHTDQQGCFGIEFVEQAERLRVKQLLNQIIDIKKKSTKNVA